MTFDTLYLVGMMRSGLHCVMAWIASQWNDGEISHYVLNDLIYLAGNVQTEASILDPAPFAEHQLCLANIEDLPFDEASARIETLIAATELRPGKIVLLIRDPFNLFASRIMCRDKSINFKAGHHTRQAVAFWLEHAITACAAEALDVDVLNYNTWVQSPAYRKQWTEEVLQVPFTDSGINYIPSNGGGSSFDGLNFQHKANKMDLFNRWKTIPEIWYQENFPRDVFEKSRELFDFCPISCPISEPVGQFR